MGMMAAGDMAIPCERCKGKRAIFTVYANALYNISAEKGLPCAG
jgi:hypothetical protein